MEATARSGTRTPKPTENTIIPRKSHRGYSFAERPLPKLIQTSRKLRLVCTIIRLIRAVDIAQRVRKKSVSEGSSMKMTKLRPATLESRVATSVHWNGQ